MAASINIAVSTNESQATVEDRVIKDDTLDKEGVAACRDYLHKVLAGGPEGKMTVSVGSKAFVAAQGTVTMSLTGIAHNETITLGANTITAKTSGASGLQFNRSDTIATALTNLANLINTNTTLNVLFSASATATTCVVTCRQPGVLGNQVTFSESAANTTLDGSGTLGGTTAGTGGDDADPVEYKVGLA